MSQAPVLSRVLHLLNSPAALFHPRIALPVLALALSRRKGTSRDMTRGQIRFKEEPA